MVFSAIDTQLAGVNNKITFLGKSLTNISRDFRSGNGILTSLFGQSVTQDDITCIANFMNQLERGVPIGRAWSSTMTGATVAGKQMAVDVKKGIVSLDDLTASMNTSKAAMLGLKVATAALNIALAMGISYGIQKAVEGVDYLIHYYENAAKKAEDNAKKSKQTADSQAEEYKTLDELIKKYKELAESEKQDSSTRSEIREIQESIVGLVGTQADNLDLVNGKLNEQLALLNEIQSVKLDNAVSSAKKAYIDARDASSSYNWKNANKISDVAANMADSNNQIITIDYWGDNKNRNKALEIINQAWQKAGYGTANVGNVGFDTFSQLIFDARLNIKERLDAINTAISALENAEDFDYLNNGLWKALVDLKDSVGGKDGVITKQIEAANDLLDIVSQQTIGSGNKDVDSLDEYMDYRQEVINSILDDDAIKQAINDGVLSSDGISSSVDSYLGSLNKYEDYYTEWYNEFKSKIATGAQEVKNAFYQNLIDKGTDENVAPFFSEQFDEWVDSLSLDDKKIIYDLLLNTDTADYTLEDWKNALANYQIPEKDKISFDELIADEDFTKNVDTYIDNVGKLKTALENLQKGDLDGKDLVELFQKFPELASNADNLEGAITNLLSSMRGDIEAQFNNQFGNLDTNDDVKALENLKSAVLETGNVVDNTDILIDVKVESEGIQDFFNVIKESVSVTGLSADSIDKLKNRYKDLEAYDPSVLFERATNGIHLNIRAVRELESVHEHQKKQNVKSTLDDLVKKYNDLTDAINETNDVSLYAQRDKLRQQIEEVAELAAQYDSLTSSFNKWKEASSTADEDDMYKSLSNGLKDIKELFDSGRVGVDDFRAAVQMMTDTDLSTASIDTLLSYYDNGYATMEKFFTGNSEGLINFLNEAKQVSDELGETWVQLDDNGRWKIDFGVGGDEAFAKAITDMTDLQMSTQEVQILLRALSAYGFDVNLDSAYTSFDLLKTKAEEANEKLIELGKTDIKFNFNADADSIGGEIEKAQALLDEFRGADGTINVGVEGAEETQEILISLITRKQMLNVPTVMKVDTSGAEENISACIGLLSDFQTNYNDIEIKTIVGMNTEAAQTNIQNILTQLSQLDTDTQATLGLDDSGFQTAVDTILATEVNVEAGINLDTAALDTVQATIQAISPEMLVELGIDASAIDGYEPPDNVATVVYNVDGTQVDKWSAPEKNGRVVYNAYLNSWTPPTKYGKVIYSATASGGAKANGTAYANGTAFKRGDWGTKGSGDALGGELGQELIVRDGRYFTIGDNGAEFFKYKKGDIIFNAEQTKQILKNGKLTNGNTRGRALARGTVEGNAFSNATGAFHVSENITATSGGNGGKGGNSSNSNGSNNEFKEVFDWIEIAINRIERTINRLNTKASSVYKLWSSRNSNLKSEMREITNEITLQQKAYDRYIQQANSVGLSSDWADLVMNGTIDISTITDEDLADQVKEFKEWYEKAIDCRDAIDKLNESLAECYKTAFDNITTEYDSILSVIEHERDMLDEYIAQSEARGYIVSTSYYDAMIQSEQRSVAQLRQEKSALLASLEQAMTSGTIEKGSEAWYEMISKINDVTLAIEEGETTILKYANSIRDIEWNVFDLLQDNISQITKEADFLINLMSNKDLHTDNGRLTNEGKATMGLHAQNYNVYMAQSDGYAKEIQDINKELANDPYNQDLLERRQKLLELQQESISTAENEKQAIVDMVKDGIELELSALQKLINTYTKALDSQKSLYDYQKKVSKQTQEISSLEKQLSAYGNDNSEETKAKIQKIKVSLADAKSNLEETQYDKYISDTKQLLEELYSEYEYVLNQRLDDIDSLIGEVIISVNDNSGVIATTIYSAADKVGYTLSNEMQNIWKESHQNVIAQYGKDFSDKATTINTTLSSVKAVLDTMLVKLGEIAVANATIASDSSVSNSSQVQSPNNLSNVNNLNNVQVFNNPSGLLSGSGFTNLSKSSTKTNIDTGKPVVSTSSSGVQGKISTNDSQYIDGIKKIYVKDFSNDCYNKFAVGVHNLDKDQLAWTQEHGREVIIRPSDGAILTPLAKNDSVLDAQASNNIWDMSTNPSDFIRNNLKLDNAVTPTNQGGQTIYQQTLENVVFSLPNVKNYEELLRAMQHDKNFERLILAMTIDRASGGSPLSKNKAIRR